MKLRLLIGALGVCAIGYALIGALSDAAVRPVGQALSLVGVVLLHDLLFMPLLLAVGALAVRYLPAVLKAPVQAGLILSAAVTVVAAPFLLGPGRTVDNPSALPLDYRRGWLILLAVIWLVTAIGVVWRYRAARLTTRSTTGD